VCCGLAGVQRRIPKSKAYLGPLVVQIAGASLTVEVHGQAVAACRAAHARRRNEGLSTCFVAASRFNRVNDGWRVVSLYVR